MSGLLQSLSTKVWREAHLTEEEHPLALKVISDSVITKIYREK